MLLLLKQHILPDKQYVQYTCLELGFEKTIHDAPGSFSALVERNFYLREHFSNIHRI